MQLKSPMRRLRLLTLIFSLVALTGCFGDGDGEERTSGNPQPTMTGVFLDSPVEGATWEGANGATGLTSANGEFSYLEFPTLAANEIITFSVGGIVLGSVQGAPFITSVELTASVDPTDQAALNQLVFMQSIDADSNPSNGITISASTRSLAENLTLDFTAADFPTAVRAVVAAISGNAVVSESAALNHFYTTYAARGGTDTFSFLFPGYAPVGGGIVFDLVFRDEFNEGTSPSSEKWTIETGYGPNNDGNGNQEWQLYTDSPDNVRVEDGNLVLSALCDAPCGVRDGSVTSGKVNTLDKFEFTYGKVIARIKVPVGEAAWPAFWSLGANWPDVGWPRSGEIDFMEAHNFYSDENTTHFTMHWCEDSIQAPLSCSYPAGWVYETESLAISAPLADDFHIFEADWNAERIIGKIDGVKYFELPIEPATMEEFQRDFFLILNVAMGGTLGSNSQPPNGTETFPQTMLVDYVRVFQGELVPPPGGGPGSNLSQINLPITFQSQTVDYTLTDFGEPVPVITTLIADQQNSGNNVASTTKPLGAPVGAGTTMSTPAGFAAPIPFTAAKTTIGIRVFSPDAGIPVRLRAEDMVGGTVSVETEVLTTVANEWETLVFDFSDQVEGTDPLDLDTSYFALSVFFNFGTDGDTAGAKTYLWDDVRFGVPLPDRMPPTLTDVSIASNNANITLAAIGNVVTVTVKADEAISAPMVTIGGVPADSVTGSGKNWLARRLLLSSDAAEGAIVIAFSIEFSDLQGNAGAPVSMTTDGSSVVLDATPPTLQIVGAPPSFTTLAPISVSFQFSEPVSDFATNDFTVLNGFVAGLVMNPGDMYTYTADVTPTGLGDLTIMVRSGAVFDAAGNANVMAAAATVLNDLDPNTPLLSVVRIFSDNDNTAYARADDVVTIEMTATVDIREPTVTIGGAPAMVTGDGTMWQASRTIIPDDIQGLIAFVINFESLAGTAGPQSTAATEGAVTVDTIEPTVLSIDGIPELVRTLDPITPVTFQFDEDVEGFDEGAIGVTNGTASGIVSVNAATYTADITPAGNGELNVMLAAGAVTDLAGNGNTSASVTATVNLETFWQLIWSDDFEGTTLNVSNWTARTDADCQDPCTLSVQSSYRTENVSVDSGVVSLAARDDPARGGLSYTGGLIDTKGKENGEFRYGRIEIDAQMPPGTLGAAPSLWLLPASEPGAPWPLSGEIDIVNAPDLGLGGNTMFEHTLHYGLLEPENTTATGFSVAPALADMQPITYALEREGGEMRWFVDGVHVATQIDDNWYAYSENDDGVYELGTGAAPFDQDFYLLMSMGVGSNADETSEFPQTLQVDEVRVFKCANPVDQDAGTGCAGDIDPVDSGIAPVVATAPPYNGAPYTEMLNVYTDAPADDLVFIGPDGPPGVTNPLGDGTATSDPSVTVTSNVAAMDGSDTYWNVTVVAPSGQSGRAFMRSRDDLGVSTGFFDLSGGGTAGELLFRMRVNAFTGNMLKVGLDSSAGTGAFEFTDVLADSTWRNYSVKISDVVSDSVMNASSVDLADVINLFTVEAVGGNADIDLDDIKVKVACRIADGCQATPRFASVDVDVEYSQDFEGLDILSPAALNGDGWIYYAAVFTVFGNQMQYDYFGPAPNFSAPGVNVAFSAVASGEGGDDQGAQQLVIITDYENGDLSAGGFRIDSSVFRERTITAADIGTTYVFSFDAKKGDLAPGVTAQAFIKTIDPGSNFDQTNLAFEDTTSIPQTWNSYTVTLDLIDPLLEGQLLQFGFSTTASSNVGSSVFYDNIEVGSVPGPP